MAAVILCRTRRRIHKISRLKNISAAYYMKKPAKASGICGIKIRNKYSGSKQSMGCSAIIFLFRQIARVKKRPSAFPAAPAPIQESSFPNFSASLKESSIICRLGLYSSFHHNVSINPVISALSKGQILAPKPACRIQK